ncbi:Mitochondrial adenine nucleotide transporter ADNT1 [Apostasia shenzhenica]|uniref:Mitochondrial adenine nucleotide transporter ADNT1 n=1 Tax=Apostasia shenzhenica TaxID=1088818 RepID=A0A2I0AKR6_9ASPA|nr:Mitochondrial adenine nucleotide transporter ADNT1 [Apostasia shenzhenica]
MQAGRIVRGEGENVFSSVHGGATPATSAGGLAADRRFSAKRQDYLQQQPQVGALPHLVAGGLAGVVSKTCTAPLARLTILFQVQGMHSDSATLSKASLFKEASRILREEGFRAFWKGNLVTIVHRLPYSAISFYSYDRYKNLLHLLPGLDGHTQYVNADVCVRLLSGGLAGMTAASITYPLDLVRTRLAVQTNYMYYQGIGHTLHTIFRDEGLRGMYKGLGASLLGVGPNIAVGFCVYESLISNWKLHRPHDSTLLVSLACGSVSGIVSSTATFPLDLVRRRKQLEGAGGRALIYKTGVWGTFRHIFRSEGFRGLYRGILPEYYKVVPSIGITFMTYETLKSYLSQIL